MASRGGGRRVKFLIKKRDGKFWSVTDYKILVCGDDVVQKCEISRKILSPEWYRSNRHQASTEIFGYKISLQK